MRRGALLAGLLLAGCGPAPRPVNHVEAVVIGPGAIGAQLYLCDRPAIAVTSAGGRYDIRLPADCEGSGRLMVRYIDGSSIVCPIRYVTPQMGAWYRFEVADGRCRIK